MKEITTVGVDLAKSVFTVHGVDRVGRTVLRKTVRREKLMELSAGLPPCLIGVEACGGAHEWARRFEACGHRIGIMMARFVPVKSAEQRGRPDYLAGRRRGRLTNWDRTRGWLCWPERLRRAHPRPSRDLQSVLPANSRRTCKLGSP